MTPLLERDHVDKRGDQLKFHQYWTLLIPPGRDQALKEQVFIFVTTKLVNTGT